MTARACLLTAVACVLVMETLFSLTATPLLRRWNAVHIPGFPKLLLWNASASAPRGLYLLRNPSPLARGEMVAITPPTSLTGFMAARGYLAAGVPLLKHIAALSGQTVCRHDGTVFVNGRAAAVARSSDHLGRPLPNWQGCRRLGAGKVVVLNPTPDSFDSRYFGALPAAAITARAMPLWTERAP